MDPKQLVLEGASRFGLGNQLLSTYDTIWGLKTTELEIDDKVRNYELSEKESEGIVLFPLIPGYRSLCVRFGVLGHAFKSRGYKPLILRDDNDLLARPELTVNETNKSRTEIYRYTAETIPEQFGIDTISIGDMLGEEYNAADMKENSKTGEYRGIAISDCAKASTRRYCRAYSIDIQEDVTKDIYQSFLKSAIQLTDAMYALAETYDIQTTVVNEPSYIQGRVPLAVCRQEDIDVYTQKWGYHKQKLLFGRDQNRCPMGQFASREVTKNAIRRELTVEENGELDRIMADWRSNEITRFEYSTDSQKSISSDDKTLVGVFTNLLWDAAIEPEQAIYDDIFAWIQDTIDTASEKEDIHLVIKPHPAEAAVGTNESVTDWIEKEYPSLPNAVTLLDPDTDINTYELISDLDAGIVYASTVGLEMVLEGTPVIVGGFPTYHGFDITYDPDTEGEYREKIRNVESLDCNSSRIKKARRFAHFLFVCKHFEFPYIEGPGNVETKPKPIQHNQIGPGNEIYDTLIQQILNGEEVLTPEYQFLKESSV